MKLNDKIDINYNGIGPKPDKIMDLSQPNLTKEIKNLKNRKKKYLKWRNTKLARKRIYTMNDIIKLRKQDFDKKAKGPKNVNEMDSIGKESLKLTNLFRKSQGLSELKWHQSLSDIGKIHRFVISFC